MTAQGGRRMLYLSIIEQGADGDKPTMPKFVDPDRTLPIAMASMPKFKADQTQQTNFPETLDLLRLIAEHANHFQRRLPVDRDKYTVMNLSVNPWNDAHVFVAAIVNDDGGIPTDEVVLKDYACDASVAAQASEWKLQKANFIPEADWIPKFCLFLLLERDTSEEMQADGSKETRPMLCVVWAIWQEGRERCCLCTYDLPQRAAEEEIQIQSHLILELKPCNATSAGACVFVTDSDRRNVREVLRVQRVHFDFDLRHTRPEFPAIPEQRESRMGNTHIHHFSASQHALVATVRNGRVADSGDQVWLFVFGDPRQPDGVWYEATDVMPDLAMENSLEPNEVYVSGCKICLNRHFKANEKFDNVAAVMQLQLETRYNNTRHYTMLKIDEIRVGAERSLHVSELALPVEELELPDGNPQDIDPPPPIRFDRFDMLAITDDGWIIVQDAPFFQAKQEVFLVPAQFREEASTRGRSHTFDSFELTRYLPPDWAVRAPTPPYDAFGPPLPEEWGVAPFELVDEPSLDI